MRIALLFLYLATLAMSKEARSDTRNTQQSQWPKLSNLEKKGAQISALMVPLDDFDEKLLPPLASYTPHKRLTPASLTKIVVAAKALEVWGPQATFTTQLAMRGERKGDTLVGDLVFMGAGDPGLVNEKLWFLATDVSRAGIKKITGKLILNTSLFGNEETPDINRKGGQKQSENAYDSPLSSVAVNYSVAAVIVSPGKNVGDPAIANLEPYPLSNSKILNQAKTVGPGFSTQLFATRKSLNGIDTFVVSGNIAQSSFPVRLYRSVGNAVEYAGAVMVAFLENSGVGVAGGYQEEKTPPKTSDIPFVTVEGYTLDYNLKGLLQYSNNFTADILTKQFSRASMGKTLGQGSQELVNYLNQLRQKAPSLTPLWEQGIPPSPTAIIESGSGLTPENKLSASDIVILLRQLYQSTRDFPIFLASLPLSGEKGTLRQRFQDGKWANIKNALRAKTGTLNDPWPAVGLGGIVRLKSGKWVGFAIIVNDPKRRCGGIERIRDAIDTDLAHILSPHI